MSPASWNDAGIPIAIVGLSCRFPGEASSPSKFWDLLRNGKSGFSPFTTRYNADAFQHPISGGKRQNIIPTHGGYFLKQDPYVFDAAFFNITAAEAVALDPRQRIALEVAYEALENAGMPLQKVAGSQTACFMGSSMSDYRDGVARDFAQAPKYHILGISDDMISNRISHFLDIHGPSATVQTACSSSLVAAHLACQSLRSGESDMALAGGVGLMISPDSTMHLNNLGFLSPTGHSRSFDADASGYGRGEGCGVLVLKRLDNAIQDGDTIRAVIRASGVNSDGWTQGLTMPSGDAQAALIKYVYESNGLDYGSTQYVEAHGTGTKAGDPIETSSIYRTIGQGGKASRKKLWIGSVKANIGHLEAAAGVASIIKGVLAMEYGLIPPNINFNKPNPSIPLDEWNMAVPTSLTPWPAVQTKRMSVSGFGMGGTNAHVVLERANKPAALSSFSNGMIPTPTSMERLFVFSSHDKAGFKRIATTLVEHLDTLGATASSPGFLADFAHTLATARSNLLWKSTCFAENMADLRDQLLTTLGENAARAPSSRPRIGFVFTGQGAQWARMGIEMLERRVFRESVAKSVGFLKDMGCEWDPVTELSKVQTESRLSVPEISQPICSVLQIALVDEIRSWGISPSKVVGHSSGEIAAAYTIGALSHRDALAVAYFRGKSSAGLKNRAGGMMAVGCSRAQAEQLMAETKFKVTVACVNSPSSVTLSGDAATLEALRVILDERGVFARRLKVDVAYHSSHMHVCSAEYYSTIDNVECSLPEYDEKEQQPIMVSSVTGKEVDPEVLGPYYWVRNLISPVLFTDAVRELVSLAAAENQKTKAIDVLIEIGPHSALGGPIEQILSYHGVKDIRYMSMLTRGQNALDTSKKLAAELFRHGVAIDVSKVNCDSSCHLLTNLPPYPWNHAEEFRADSRVQRERVTQKFPTRSLIGAQLPSMDESERVWRGFIRLDDEPWLRDHTVGTSVLFPGAGMVSIVLEAAQQIVDQGKTPRSFRMRDVSFLAAMVLPENVATEVTIHMRPHLPATSGSTPAAWWEFTVSSCAGPKGQMRNNCRGLITIVYEENRSRHMAQEEAKLQAVLISDYHRILLECPEACSKELFYDRMAKSALPYGEIFQGVENCRPGPGKTVYNVRLVDIGETFTKGKLERPFFIHGATLDTIFQGWLGSTCRTDNSRDFGFDKSLLPTAIGELEISADIPADVGSVIPGFCLSHRHSFNEFSASIYMLDEELSRVLLSVADFRTSEVEIEDSGKPDQERGAIEVDQADIISEVQWNYALDVLEPAEIKQAVLGAASSTNDRLIELIRLVIHQRPAVKVIELAEGLEELSGTAMSKLPRGIILPTQVRYALVDAKVDNDPAGDIDDDIFGKPFALGTQDTPLSADIAPADLFVIPHCVSNNHKHDLDSILERLLSLAKPGAVVAFAAAISNSKEISALKAKGFECTFNALSDGERLALYYRGHETQEPENLTNGITNGVHRKEVTVLEPTESSAAVQLFSTELQAILQDQGYSVSTKTGVLGVAADAIEGKAYISLLELEQPMLQDLSQPVYQSLQTLMVNCERLLWITRGDNPSLRIIDGLARCVNGEVGSKFQILHLKSEGAQHGPSLATRILKSSDGHPTTDTEFREQDGLLQVSRLYMRPKENDYLRNHLEDSTRVRSLQGDRWAKDTDHFRLTIGKPGLLDTLHFVHDQCALLTPLRDDEVEMQVKATGVNFRDIMASMGLVPARGLGQEASGIILRTGSRAAEAFKPGDRVSAVSTGGTHATKTRCDYRVTAKIPDTMSFEEAAASPMAHATAYHALIRLAKLRRGQSMLIHAAAGGVGQAAVQLAKHLGLVIYVTVGTEDKRRFIIEQYGIPDQHIFNSRDSSFVKGIQRVTNSRGVDCVLNSLSGELLRVSWGCLATFGTFVEIGLRDITNNMRLDMRPFGNSTTFTFFNIQTLIDEDPATLGETLTEAFKLMQEGVLHAPSPLTVYPVGQVEEAFRTMQQGRHRGKLVLSFDNDKLEATVLCKAKDSLKLDPDATYLLIGGLGGLGRSLAIELIASGCRHLAFISRSGDTRPEAKAVVDELTGRGAQVKVFRGDVADEASFLDAMADCSQQLPPVKGVIQMAMVLRDAVFENMTYEEWTVPLQPKVQGTWNLHKYFSHERPLDFMIFCSSISGLCGNPGQAQYAAGNTYQDALAHYRRAQGLNAVSVNLGIMLDVGVIAETGAHNFKVWEEVLGIREPAFHGLMRSLVNGQQRKRSGEDEYPAQISTGLGTADILSAHGLPSPAWFKDPRFGPLAVSSVSASTSASDSTAGASLVSRLSEAGHNKDSTAAATIITGALVKKIAETLRIPASEVDPSRPMYHYGVDSLVALEVRNWITREIKANMALLDILAAVPMETFAGQIAEKSKLVVGATL
ncbi:phenolpthiocerol synthesis polyketide synthase ppsB [Aspergillus coremiiformis]|uniref:Phenolpthiocerol synthesis polyketide synthase ppsB n=1 Tax=Aspergillus coremiiformis TaxID=138285 RepID=A0A5N6YZ88_9EURO|nr:phenolpthiocerol synthesis polyketide synthase ppsB [Aspergillus coremiiformis]